MALRDLVTETTEEVKPRKLWAAWLQTTVLAGLIAVAGYVAHAEPFLLAVTVTVAALLSLLVLQFVKPRLLALGVVSALAILFCGLIAWTVWENRKVADNYSMYFDHALLLHKVGKTPDGRPVITAANWRIYVSNPNDFTVYVSTVRRYGRIEKSATNLSVADDEAAEVTPVDKGALVYCESDDIPTELYLGHYYQGEVSCILKYGKSNARREKVFDFTRKVQFLICPGTDALCDISFT